jgi:hypothetical protein
MLDNHHPSVNMIILRRKPSFLHCLLASCGWKKNTSTISLNNTLRNSPY